MSPDTIEIRLVDVKTRMQVMRWKNQNAAPRRHGTGARMNPRAGAKLSAVENSADSTLGEAARRHYDGDSRGRDAPLRGLSLKVTVQWQRAVHASSGHPQIVHTRRHMQKCATTRGPRQAWPGSKPAAP